MIIKCEIHYPTDMEQTSVEMRIIAIVIEKYRLSKNIDCQKWT